VLYYNNSRIYNRIKVSKQLIQEKKLTRHYKIFINNKKNTKIIVIIISNILNKYNKSKAQKK